MRGGIVFAAAGIAMMCGMDAVAKALGAELTTFQIVFVRYLGAALWLMLWIASGRGSWPRLADVPRQALRGPVVHDRHHVLSCRRPPAHRHGRRPRHDRAALRDAARRADLSRAHFRARLAGIAGAAIIVLGGTRVSLGDGGTPLVWAAALLAPLSYAVLLVVLKHHASRETPEAMTLGQSLLAALLALPFAFGPVPTLSTQALGLVALIGLLGAAGFLFLISGLKRIPVTVFAVIDYTGLLWAAIFGLVFFAEIPGMPLWIGGAFIISACVLTGREERRPIAEKTR